MKIGIYTIITDSCYGAQLQAYATAHYLQQICGDSASVELVRIGTMRGRRNWRSLFKSCFPQEVIRRKRFEDFQTLSHVTRRYTCDEIVNRPLGYDLHIVGSDQVWNVSHGIDNHLSYFLPFRTTAPKIALASSFGTASIPDKFKKQIYDYLSDFSSIAVREFDGVKILAEMGIKAEEIADPTLWLEWNEWNNLAGEKPLIKGDYIAAIGFETSNQNPQKLMDCVKRDYPMPVVGLITSRRFHYDIRRNSYGPKEFLNVIKFSNLVVTSSFHTLVFSLLFKKDFFLLKHSERNSRMENLLRRVGLMDRMLDGSLNDFSVSISNSGSIDFVSVTERIEEMRASARKYIGETLHNITGISKKVL